MKGQFASTADRFREKMTEFCKDGSNQMVFTEDLKNMVHLAEQNGTDIELVVKMMKKFKAQNQELRFGSYVFGPVIMRMFHHLGEVDTAYNCFKDPALDGLFDQWATYQILLDMLYDNGRYNDVIDTFKHIYDKQSEGGRYPKYAMVVVFGACYKLNTPESYEYAVKLWKSMIDVGVNPMRRTITFAAALALTQNAPHVALEILYSSRQQNYITVRNLKVIAMLDMGRIDDVIPILRSVLESRDGALLAKQTFAQEVIDRVTDVIGKSNNKEMQLDYERILKFLTEHGHISAGTLDDLLCSQIDTTQQPGNQQYNKQQTVLRSSFSRQGNQGGGSGYDRRGNTSTFRRAGLKDMY